MQPKSKKLIIYLVLIIVFFKWFFVPPTYSKYYFKRILPKLVIFKFWPCRPKSNSGLPNQNTSKQLRCLNRPFAPIALQNAFRLHVLLERLQKPIGIRPETVVHFPRFTAARHHPAVPMERNGSFGRRIADRAKCGNFGQRWILIVSGWGCWRLVCTSATPTSAPAPERIPRWWSNGLTVAGWFLLR